jgi:2'-5' RNA ligase
MAFIGIPIPAQEITKLAMTATKLPGQLEPPSEYHTTLFYLGKGTSFSVLMQALVAIQPVVASYSKFLVGAARMIAFPKGDDGHPLVARVLSPVLHNLRTMLATVLDTAGVSYSKKWPIWIPHICLSYSPHTMLANDLVTPIVWQVDKVHVWGGDDWNTRFHAELELGTAWP